VGDGIEHQRMASAKRQRHRRTLSRLHLQPVEGDALHHLLEIGRQFGGGAPEDLARVIRQRQRIGIVGGDAAHARIDGERHLDMAVERGLAIRRAERAEIFRPVERLQRRRGLQHAAAAGAKRAPRHVEQPQMGGAHQGAHRRILVEPMLGGEGERVDARQPRIRRGLNLAFQRGGGLGLSGFGQQRPQRVCVGH
jgi:hypothetical protein